MSIISIRLPEKMLHEMDVRAKMLHIQRAEYIREAIKHMNAEVEHRARKERLKKASLRVRSESMRINAEFSRIEHDPKD